MKLALHKFYETGFILLPQLSSAEITGMCQHARLLWYIILSLFRKLGNTFLT
jgi:hypothetical protein